MMQRKLLFLIIVLLMSGCRESQEQNLNAVSTVQVNVATQKPSPTHVNTPTTLPTLTMMSTPPETPTLTSSQTEIAPTIEVQETVTPFHVGLGRLYFARTEWYGWFDLVAQENGQEYILDNTDYYHRYSSLDLIEGPGDHKKLEFSYYSDLIAYASFTSYPGEFWLSDVVYHEPQKLFTDTDGRFDWVTSDFVEPWSYLKIVWSPDDKHIILYHVSQPELSLIYHLESGELEEWCWKCNSIVLSSQSGRLATLCPRVDAAPADQKDYAVLEWGGAIWYSDVISGQMFLQAAADDTELWRFSADGEQLAFYDPNDIEGHLFIADSQGNIQKFLPGISVFRKFEAVDIEYSPRSVLNYPHFVWARNAPILLAKGYAQPDSPCPPFISDYAPDVYVEHWPCWQAINIEDGEVVWSEAVLGESLSLNEEGEDPFYMAIADLTVSPDGRFIAFHSFQPMRRIVIVDLFTAKVTTISEYDVMDKLYWTFRPEN